MGTPFSFSAVIAVDCPPPEVTGMAAGHTKAFALTFPADYHGREVAGKEAQFTLTAHEIAEPEVPALDEAFARGFGIASGSIDDLRKEVEANLAARSSAGQPG